MKLFILLIILSFANCGINNNINLLKNDTIFLAHTDNAVIYKLTRNGNEYIKKIVIGNENIVGNKSDYNGLEVLLKKPKSIISDFNERVLFFIDDNKFIKRSTIDNPNNKGIQIINITNIESSFTNIYENTANNYAGYNNDTYLFFVSSCNLHKINLTMTIKSK